MTIVSLSRGPIFAGIFPLNEFVSSLNTGVREVIIDYLYGDGECLLSILIKNACE